MASIKQRFQNLKDYINTELRSILTAYPEETEQVASEIDSLAFYLKDSNDIAKSALVARVAKNGYDVNAHAELAIITADSFSDSCQANGERVVSDEVSSLIVHNNNARSEHRNDENQQNEEPLMQSLSLICDDILAAENQDVVEAASEHISLETEGEDKEEEPVGQDIREQGEGEAASTDEACEGQDSEPDSEEEPQAQDSDKAILSEHMGQRNSATPPQSSTASASSRKLKRNRVTNNAGDSSNKRQRRSMTADVKHQDMAARTKYRETDSQCGTPVMKLAGILPLPQEQTTG